MSFKQEQHDMIQALTQLALELGRTPTRDEFRKLGRNYGNLIGQVFGDYSALVQAAGLEPARTRRITNDIFKVSIDAHLEKHWANEKPLTLEPYPSAAIISDIHWPFENKKVVKAFTEYCGDVKPANVIINGDGWDMFSHGKFPRTHNLFTPREEETKARQMNETFWQAIQQASPKSQCVQMLGNHDVRPLKRVLEAYPEAEDWIKEKLNRLFTFEGVKTIHDPREELFLSSQVVVFHGYRTKLGDHRDYTLYSTCNGHSHVGGVVFRKIRGVTLFELNSGFAGDPEAKGLTYTPQKITNWTPGFAIINKWGPQFVSIG